MANKPGRHRDEGTGAHDELAKANAELSAAVAKALESADPDKKEKAIEKVKDDYNKSTGKDA